jgi:hypothetical protein
MQSDVVRLHSALLETPAMPVVLFPCSNAAPNYVTGNTSLVSTVPAATTLQPAKLPESMSVAY